jgi:hypothetical protein
MKHFKQRKPRQLHHLGFHPADAPSAPAEHGGDQWARELADFDHQVEQSLRDRAFSTRRD